MTGSNAVSFEKTDRNKVKRVPKRGHYDRDTINKILDAGFLCHAGFIVDDQPFVIPTLYGRIDDRVYLHGSAASRMLKSLADGVPVCLTVTHVDGLVLARSAFHHSMNYRSAVLFGNAVPAIGAEKDEGLFAISEQVLKGRWQETRSPNDKELKATTVLRVDVESAFSEDPDGPTQRRTGRLRTANLGWCCSNRAKLFGTDTRRRTGSRN